MSVIPLAKSALGSLTPGPVREADKGHPIIDGETGNLDFACPNCGAVLLTRMSHNQARGEFGQTFLCKNCGEYSEVPSSF